MFKIWSFLNGNRIVSSFFPLFDFIVLVRHCERPCTSTKSRWNNFCLFLLDDTNTKTYGTEKIHDIISV